MSSGALTPYLAERCGALLHTNGAAQLITLGDRKVHIQLETPESASELAPIADPRVRGLEAMLLESFRDNVYDDGSLMLLTATDIETGTLAALGEQKCRCAASVTVLAVFWRDLPSAEVSEWLASPAGAANSTCRDLVHRSSSWTKIELLETAHHFRGQGDLTRHTAIIWPL